MIPKYCVRYIRAGLQLERIILPGHQYCYPINYQNQLELHYCSLPIASLHAKEIEDLYVKCLNDLLELTHR